MTVPERPKRQKAGVCMRKKFLGIACVCAVIAAVILISNLQIFGNGGLENGSGIGRRPGAAYIPEEVVSVEVSHAHGEMVTWKVTGGELDALRAWVNGLRYHPVVFAEGETPGDADGGENYSFTDTEGNVTDFSYVMNGGDENYLLTEGNWYRVDNPSPPPVEKN